MLVYISWCFLVLLDFFLKLYTMLWQVYDMRFELNEIEARREQYPSTISFLNLLNALTAEERDVGDRGRRHVSIWCYIFFKIFSFSFFFHYACLFFSLFFMALLHRFIGIFRFVYDHVFGPFPQRAYADASEKWQLAISCLQHFRMWVHNFISVILISLLFVYVHIDLLKKNVFLFRILKMYDTTDEDIDSGADQSSVSQSTPLQMQIPIIELLKVFCFAFS